jgi:hypothetical protein
MELSQFTTKELPEELNRRAGVNKFVAEPHEPFKIFVGGNFIEHEGPATILVNID